MPLKEAGLQVCRSCKNYLHPNDMEVCGYCRWDQRMLDWYGLTPADRGRRCPRRLVGRQQCVAHYGYGHTAPHRKCLCQRYAGHELMDHTRLWRDAGKRLVFTTEPYDVDIEDIAEFTVAMSVEGIDVTVGDRSPWNPGSTTLLLLTGMSVS